jgi:hypothetical protein
MSTPQFTREQKNLKDSFELHLRDLLTKFDAEMFVDDDGEKITVKIPAIKAGERGGFTRPEVIFSKGSFWGKDEGELDG